MDNLNSEVPQSSGSAHKVLTKIIIVILLIALLIAGGYIIYLSQPTEQPAGVSVLPEQNLSADQPKWSIPSSKVKGVPVSIDGQLYVYSTSDQTFKPVAKDVNSGGSLGLGSTGAVSSPDLLYTAFTTTLTPGLFLLSNETLEYKKIGEYATYISDWSADSKRLIFYMEQDTLMSRVDGPGEEATVEKFNPNQGSGFYSLEIQTGKLQRLGPLQHVVGFIDNNRVLAKTEDQSDRMVIFNIDTFEADYVTVKDQFGFGAGQFDFSSDGKKWTYTLSRNPTTDANIILADFPNKEGVQIDSGAWAEVQRSLLSPDTTKVVYQKAEGDNASLPDFALWLYDVNAKTKKRVSAGSPVLWVDNENVLVTIGFNPQRYSIVNVQTGAVKELKP